MDQNKLSIDKNKIKTMIDKEKEPSSKRFHIDIFYIDEECLLSNAIRISYKDKYYIIKQHNKEISSSTIESAVIIVSQILTRDLFTLLEFKKTEILDWNCIGIYVNPFEYVWSDVMNDVPAKYQEGVIPKDDIQTRDSLYLKSIQRKLIQWMRVIKDCRIN